MKPYEALTEETLNKTIEEANLKFKYVFDRWKKGLFCEDDLVHFYSSIFEGHYVDVIEKSNLELLFSTLRKNKRHSLEYRTEVPFCRTAQGIWERFTDDYYLWKSGRRPCSIVGDVWLTYKRSEGTAGGYLQGDEASYADKERFFRLMEAFGVPLSFYQPAPPDIIFSNLRFAHHPKCIRVGFDLWEDDGGLFSENFKIGDTITPTDVHGLKSVIKITDHLTSEEDQKRRAFVHSFNDFLGLMNSEGYVGFGHIEGYTSMRDRPIDISVKNGKIFSMYTNRESDDYEAFNTFPLWKDERKYNSQIYSVRTKIIKDLTRRFAGDDYYKFWPEDTESEEGAES